MYVTSLKSSVMTCDMVLEGLIRYFLLSTHFPFPTNSIIAVSLLFGVDIPGKACFASLRRRTFRHHLRSCIY